MIKKIKERLSSISPAEFSKFFIIGISCFFADYILYRLFLRIGLNIYVSKYLSYVICSSIAFVVNKLWTFGVTTFRYQEVFKYIGLYVVTAVINSAVNKQAFSITGLSLLSVAFATGISMVINFLGLKFLVFSTKKVGN